MKVHNTPPAPYAPRGLLTAKGGIGVLYGPEIDDRPNLTALEEFLVHGLKVCFPCRSSTVDTLHWQLSAIRALTNTSHRLMRFIKDGAKSANSQKKDCKKTARGSQMNDPNLPQIGKRPPNLSDRFCRTSFVAAA